MIRQASCATQTVAVHDEPAGLGDWMMIDPAASIIFDAAREVKFPAGDGGPALFSAHAAVAKRRPAAYRAPFTSFTSCLERR